MSTDASLAPRQDAYVIALVGFAHSVSLLPPAVTAPVPVADARVRPGFRRHRQHHDGLLPGLRGRPGAGQLAVDRFGPVRVLAAGISCFVAAGCWPRPRPSSS